MKHIKMMKHIEMMKHARQIDIRAKNFSPLQTRRIMVCRNNELHKGDVGVRAKNFSPLQTQRIMVCRNNELHKDDIVGAGFARPHHRPHHRLGTELHNGGVGVGAKNFSPQRRFDCRDNQTSFSPNFDNKTTSVARRQHTYNNLITSLFLCTDVSSLRDLMEVGDVFSTDMSSLRDLPDDEHDTCEYTVNQVSSLRDLSDDDGYRMLKHTVNKVSSLRDLSDDNNNARKMDCFAALANASSTESMTDNIVIANTKATNHRHCEERSDEAIHNQVSSLRDLSDADGYRMLKHTVNQVSSLRDFSDDEHIVVPHCERSEAIHFEANTINHINHISDK